MNEGALYAFVKSSNAAECVEPLRVLCSVSFDLDVRSGSKTVTANYILEHAKRGTKGWIFEVKREIGRLRLR